MIIEKLNSVLNYLGDLVWSMLGQQPYLTLTLVAFIAGIVLVYLYGKVSRQAQIKLTKRSIYGALLEAILFRHSGRLTLKAQARMFVLGGRYLMLALPPLIILMLPCILLLSQINRFMGYEPLHAHSTSLVSVVADQDTNLFNLQLKSDNQSLLVSKPVRLPQDHSVLWRLNINEDTNAQLILSSGAENATVIPLKMNWQDQALAILSNNWWDRLLYPTVGQMPEGVESLAIVYNDAKYSLLGWKVHWLIFFFIVSLISGLAASKLLKIEV